MALDALHPSKKSSEERNLCVRTSVVQLEAQRKSKGVVEAKEGGSSLLTCGYHKSDEPESTEAIAQCSG